MCRTTKGMRPDNTINAKIKGGQIEVFKILNGYENIDLNIFFKIKESKITRGHNFTLANKQLTFNNRIKKYLVKAGYKWNKGRLHSRLPVNIT